jgi:hypothetical protein
LLKPTARFLWALTVGDNTDAAVMNAGPPGLAAFENLHGLCEIVAHLCRRLE